MNAPQPRPRGKPSSEGRFTWQSSLALERIVNSLGQTQAAYGVAVYVALTRSSSRDKNNPVIVATINHIAGAARLGYRKTFEVLYQLVDAGVIAIAESARTPGTKYQLPNTYTLLSLHNGKSGRLHNGKRSDCTGRTPSRAENPKELPTEAGIESAPALFYVAPPAGAGADGGNK